MEKKKEMKNVHKQMRFLIPGLEFNERTKERGKGIPMHLAQDPTILVK